MTDFLERRRHGWFPAFYDTGGTGSNYPAAVVAGENSGINQAFQPFPYPNTTGAANNAYSGIAGDTNPAGQSALNSAGLGAINYGQQLPGQLAPVAQQGLTAGTNIYNSLSGQAQVPIQAGQSTYNNLVGQAGTVMNAGNNVSNFLNQESAIPADAGQAQYNALAPYVTQALQQGFDPQNALYNQQYNLQQQQNMASQAMSGVGQSPYAAGLTAQGDQNFNIAWQQSQLAREAQAAQTAGGLSSTAMNDLNSGYNQATNMILGGNQALNNSYQTGSNMELGGANALNAGYTTGANLDTAAMNALSSGISDYSGITGLGISGMEGLIGTGGNALTQATGMNAQQVAQYLAYLQGSTYNAAAATGAQLGSLQQGTNLYGATNQGNLAQQQQVNNALGGLGTFAGSTGGSNLLTNAGNTIAGGLGSLGSALAP